MIILIILFFHSVLIAGTPIQDRYYGPTEQLIKRESWGRIEKKLKKMDVPTSLYPYFDSIASYEDWGHIGYHGANQGFRIYQDIIRFIVEEILKIPVRESFHFLRIPGDPDYDLNSIDEFLDYWGKMDNKGDTRSKQLLSMNYGLYSNYDKKGSCSLNLFVKDKSKTSINYAKQLAPFFKELGINPKELNELFKIAHQWLDEEGGVLLQLAETSHIEDPKGEAYNFLDTLGYPCIRGGHQVGSYLISDDFERIMTDEYINHKVDIAPQLRLLVSNRFTLNPNSQLQIKRWDLYDAKIIKSYENEMRAHVKGLVYDTEKAKSYCKYLQELWNSK